MELNPDENQEKEKDDNFVKEHETTRKKDATHPKSFKTDDLINFATSETIDPKNCNEEKETQ
jgi:hypothetical protein